MMGEGGAGGEQKGSGDTDDDLLDKMMGEGGAGGSADEPKKEEEPKEKSKDGTDDDLLDKMLDE